MTGFIDVWYGDIWLDCDRARLTDELSSEELEFAQTIRNQQRQIQYLNTRYQIRTVLASYLAVNAKALKILKAEHGKPYLGCASLYFNVSHSGTKLAVAVTDIGEVGIDIEHDKKRYSLTALAERCFAPEELEYWRGLSGEVQVQTFYRFWTAKEAYVKAVGRGIALGVERCVINPNQPDRFMRLPDECGRPEAWRIFNFDTDPTYCGAVAIEIGDRALRLQRKSFLSLLSE